MDRLEANTFVTSVRQPSVGKQRNRRLVANVECFLIEGLLAGVDGCCFSGHLRNIRRMVFHMRLLPRLGRLVSSRRNLFVVVFFFLLHFFVVGNIAGVCHDNSFD